MQIVNIGKWTSCKEIVNESVDIKIYSDGILGSKTIIMIDYLAVSQTLAD